ncbi:MAG: hypothetical protein OXB99_04325 [Acidimicrobiaceae bacterium]|nr:hypothetical protein [Acidimicrobiaceae bacterium]
MRQLLIHLGEAGFGGASRFLDTEYDGSMVPIWVEGRVRADAECWRLRLGELASGEAAVLSRLRCGVRSRLGLGRRSPGGRVGTGCERSGDVAPRNTVFAGGRTVAFIDWDGIFVSTPMLDLAHAVWQFAPVCNETDRWLDGWPSRLNRPARIAALAGGYGLAPGGADELAAMVVDHTPS